MQHKCLRLFGLLQFLERRGPVTLASICKFVRASERSVYRDISDLRSIGIPITSDGARYMLEQNWQQKLTLEQIQTQLKRR